MLRVFHASAKCSTSLWLPSTGSSCDCTMILSQLGKQFYCRCGVGAWQRKRWPSWLRDAWGASALHPFPLCPYLRRGLLVLKTFGVLSLLPMTSSRRKRLFPLSLGLVAAPASSWLFLNPFGEELVCIPLNTVPRLVIICLTALSSLKTYLQTEFEWFCIFIDVDDIWWVFSFVRRYKIEYFKLYSWSAFHSKESWVAFLWTSLA